ncbi:aldo/keto reductase [Agromyces sp. NPDC056965]|uniref:aldo/keto reductase n=1 Tax=Agromyces sp. NPDC056965 TaxID=3345983 RepID=UPI0036398281
MLGTAQLGNLGGPMDDATAAALLEAAWAAGVRQFDTAPHYGLGLSERRLGRFLATKPREEFRVSTKVGRLLVPAPERDHPLLDDEGFHVPRAFHRRWDFSARGIGDSLEGSRERLGLEHIDIAYLHDPEQHAETAMGEGYRALAEFRATGVVGEIGVGNRNVELLRHMVEELDLDRIMLAGRFTLLDQSAAHSLFPACRRRGVGIDNASVFNSGILAESPIADGAWFDHGVASTAVLDRARRIERVVTETGSTLPAAALAFAAAADVVRTVVVGATSAAQLRQIVEWRDAPPAPATWAQLAEVDLIEADLIAGEPAAGAAAAFG